MATHRLTLPDARRIAVRAQLLTRDRPVDLLETVRHLTLLQDEPTAAVAPSAQVVAWSRLRTAEELALFRAEMAAWPGPGELRDWQLAQRDWLEANDGCRRDILDKLYDEGPLPARELPDTTLVPWESSGWNNDRSVRMLLNLLVRRGEVAAAGRDGRERLWDLAERVYPDVPAVRMEEAWRIRAARTLRALGIMRPRVTDATGLRVDVGDVGETVVVAEARGRWWVDPAYLEGPFEPRTALLSPLDRLVFDRKRMADLFGFDYQLEMYKPAARRRWGYWAMPILHGDRLVGKLDATAERDRGVLRVDAIHEDEPFDPVLRKAVDSEVESLSRFLGLEVEHPPGGVR